MTDQPQGVPSDEEIWLAIAQMEEKAGQYLGSDFWRSQIHTLVREVRDRTEKAYCHIVTRKGDKNVGKQSKDK